MKVCVLCCAAGSNDSKLMEIGKAISQGLEGKGNNVDVLNFKTDTDKRLTLYDYLVIVSEPVSLLSGKVPSGIDRYLENAGMVSGKRAATVLFGGMLKQKAMSNLMKVVEGQGIILKTSEFVKSTGEARAFGGALNVERNYK